jgi:hypothetical protein
MRQLGEGRVIGVEATMAAEALSGLDGVATGEDAATPIANTARSRIAPSIDNVSMPKRAIGLVMGFSLSTIVKGIILLRNHITFLAWLQAQRRALANKARRCFSS